VTGIRTTEPNYPRFDSWSPQNNQRNSSNFRWWDQSTIKLRQKWTKRWTMARRTCCL